MHVIFKSALAAAALSALPSTASAQGVLFEANGARAEGRWGAELGLGYRIGMAGFAITPAIGAFLHRGDNDRFERETFSNGQSRCRDTSNGQFTEDSDCINIAVKAYGRLEATYAPTAAIEFGAGARLSQEQVRPYGTLALGMGPALRLKANAGKRYYALGITARF